MTTYAIAFLRLLEGARRRKAGARCLPCALCGGLAAPAFIRPHGRGWKIVGTAPIATIFAEEVASHLRRMYAVRAFRTVGLAIQENVWLIWFEGSGCDCLLMQAASLLDGFSFDLFPPFENDLAAPKVDVSWRHVNKFRLESSSRPSQILQQQVWATSQRLVIRTAACGA